MVDFFPIPKLPKGLVIKTPLDICSYFKGFLVLPDKGSGWVREKRWKIPDPLWDNAAKLENGLLHQSLVRDEWEWMRTLLSLPWFPSLPNVPKQSSGIHNP